MYQFDNKTLVLMIIVLTLLGALLFVTGFLSALLMVEQNPALTGAAAPAVTAPAVPGASVAPGVANASATQTVDAARADAAGTADAAKGQVADATAGAAGQADAAKAGAAARADAAKQQGADATAQAGQAAADAKAQAAATAGGAAGSAQATADATATGAAEQADALAAKVGLGKGADDAKDGATPDATGDTAGDAAQGAAKGDYMIQVGAFLRTGNAEKLSRSLTGKGYPTGVVTREDDGGRTWSMVYVGGYADEAEADKVAAVLRDKEHLGAIVFAPGDAPSVDYKPTGTIHSLQYGSFLAEGLAVKAARALRDKGYPACHYHLFDDNDSQWFIVEVGSFEDKAEAKKAAAKFTEKEGKPVRIRALDAALIADRKACP